MRLFNNPEFVKHSDDAGRQLDGTFLHEDQVFETIARTSTPPKIWNENAEVIKSVVQTITNYSPISINILDYWNKNELYAVCIPNDPKSLDYIDPKKHTPEPNKGFFINAILGLQERLAEMYMNNFYSVAFKTRNSHTLRIDLMHTFKRYGIDINSLKDKKLLFRNVNALFYEPRFLTNKEYNLKKGKSITFKYATQAAWDAKIEGSLTSESFFCEYKETGIFQYEVNSVILKNVYDAFVKPLAHPLGMNGYYSKVCKTDLTDKVLGKILWTADAVTVRCKNKSDTLPVPAPPMLVPYIHNPKYGPNIEVYGQNLPNTVWVLIPNTEYRRETVNQKTVVTFNEARNEDDRIRIIGFNEDGTQDEFLFTSNQNQTTFTVDKEFPDLFPNEEKWIHDLPYPSAIPNTENIIRNEDIKDANHPNNPLPNIVFATKDGTGLSDLIKDIDEGQGNILQDITHGYGENEYSGYLFNKYIFKNNSYLIEYYCQKENGLYERLIEYYRYDSYDLSVHHNTVGATKPDTIYPISKNTNLVNGVLSYLNPNDGPISNLNPFGFDNVKISDPNNPDSLDPNGSYEQPYGLGTNLGLDQGVWYPLPAGYPSIESSYVKINDNGGTAVMPHNFEGVALQGFAVHTDFEEAVLLPGVTSYTTNLPFTVGIIENYAVYVDGLRLFPEIQDSIGNIVYPGDYTISVSNNQVALHFNNLSNDLHDIIVIKEVPEIKYTYPAVTDPNDPNIILRPEQELVVSEGTTYQAVKITQEMLESKSIPGLDKKYNINIFKDGLLLPSWFYSKQPSNNNINFKKDMNLNLDDILVIVWYPEPVRSTHISATVDDSKRSEYFPIALPPLNEVNATKFYIDVPFTKDGVFLFTEGKIRRRATYDVVRVDNEWTVPRTPIYWTDNRNLVHSEFRFVPIHTLVARFIQTRECKVNTFNLKQTELPSIQEEFLVQQICYNKNITHYTYDVDGNEIVTNVIDTILDDINTPNVLDQKPRVPGVVYTNVEEVPVNIQNSARKG